MATDKCLEPCRKLPLDGHSSGQSKVVMDEEGVRPEQVSISELKDT